MRMHVAKIAAAAIVGFFPAAAHAQVSYMTASELERASVDGGEGPANSGGLRTFQKLQLMKCRDGICKGKVVTVARNRELVVNYYSCFAVVDENSKVGPFALLTQNAAAYAPSSRTMAMFWSSSEQVFFVARAGDTLEITVQIDGGKPPNSVGCTVSGRYL